VKSLDPRVERLPEKYEESPGFRDHRDQFGTFEVFVEPNQGKPFRHEGSLHAPNRELAYVLAKENFTRRFTCTSLFVVETHCIYVSEMTTGNRNVYDFIEEKTFLDGDEVSFEIFQLAKRGKQHVHSGRVSARSPAEALLVAKKKFDSGKVIVNVWVARTDDIRFTNADDADFWLTLPEKKFRDAIDYKGGQKLTAFLEKNSNA